MRGIHQRLTTLLIGGLLLALPLTAQVPANVEFDSNGLSILTKANFERLLLTVGGPNDTVFTQEYDSGSSLYFSLSDQEMADGQYTYELKHAPAASNNKFRNTGTTFNYGDSTLATGAFTVRGGQIILDRPEQIETKDQVFLDDLIVDGSACIGQDCANGENFGFDTLRLKENNLRIKFDDTSSSGSFPNVDWQLTANDSDNGGANRFSIEDVTNNKNIFTVEANAQANTLYVEADGDVGIKTSEPVVDLHIVEGNSPTLRLEQDGSDGFASQTWDLAGNESNFFIRDVTNSSKLPFRIKPGAPDDSIFIAASGNVGVGTDGPSNPLHVRRTDGTANVFVEDTFSTGTTQLLRLEANAQPRFTMVNGAGDRTWHVQVTTSDDSMSWIDAGPTGVAGTGEVMNLATNGNLTISGSLTTAGGTTPDYVFEDDYDLLTLEEVEAHIEEKGHLPRVPSAAEISETGLNLSDMSNRLLEKVEELTLYTIDQHKMIAQQQELIAELQNRLEKIETGNVAQN